MIRLRNPQDLAAGIFLIVVAVLALVFSTNLPIGKLVNMGPGYVPRTLSWVLGGLGVLIAGRAFTIDGPRLDSWALRPLAALTASILVFAFLLERAGLMIAIIVTVAVARMAAPGLKLSQVIGVGVVLAVGSALLFVSLLGLPLRIWPEFSG